MQYKYETHLHTKEGSACSSSTGAMQARAHKEAGYTGIFVTDHFFNGNCAVKEDLPWKEKVNIFCSGYEGAKEEGDKIGLDVFFGFEFNFIGAEFLVYNLDKKWLLEHEDIDKVFVKKALKMMRDDGAFIVQAHPFRERDYLMDIKLYPRDVDGVEAVNASQTGADKVMNDRAYTYAKMYDLPVTGGSDTHHIDRLYGGGIITKKKIVKPLDYLEMMKNGELQIL